jgi:GNAT superfamily N-acetyltransferase
VSTPGITFGVLDGGRTAEHADEFQDLHREACDMAEDVAAFAGQFRVRRRQPGFVLARACHGGYLVGYAAGMPLRPSTSWWKGLTTPLPDEVTAEHPGRTFAVTDLLVRAPWRRQGIGASLHELILRARTEERATLVLPPAATPAQQAFRAWGWRKIARTRGPDPDSPVLDVLVTRLAAGRDR